MHEIVKTVVCKKNYEYIHITYIHIQPCVLCNAAILSIYKIENFTAFATTKGKAKKNKKNHLKKPFKIFFSSFRPVVGYIFIAQNVKLGQN